MRGAQFIYRIWNVGVGIIPADAGSTDTILLDDQGRGDHPRGCGEHQVTADQWLADPGSSPRMRGAHLKILAIPTI